MRKQQRKPPTTPIVHADTPPSPAKIVQNIVEAFREGEAKSPILPRFDVATLPARRKGEHEIVWAARCSNRFDEWRAHLKGFMQERERTRAAIERSIAMGSDSKPKGDA